MTNLSRILLPLTFLMVLGFLTVGAQKPAPTPTPSPTGVPMDMKMPMSSPTPTPTPPPMRMPMDMKMPSPEKIVPPASGDLEPDLPPFPAPKSWGEPVEDEMLHGFFLADILEFSPKGSESIFRWDSVGWYGGDFNRLWIKSEGEGSTVDKDYKADFQLLYGRFVKTYYDFQIGGRIQTKSLRGRNATRLQGVVGIEGLRPYKYEIEALAFLDPKGNVSGRFTASRDYLITQRLALQPRFETNMAIQQVDRFKTGRGLNDIDLGLRLRYAIRREFAPYIGVSYERSFFGTADLVRQDGGSPSEFRVVLGVRLWH